MTHRRRNNFEPGQLTANQRFRHSDLITDFVTNENLGKMALGIVKYAYDRSSHVIGVVWFAVRLSRSLVVDPNNLSLLHFLLTIPLLFILAVRLWLSSSFQYWSGFFPVNGVGRISFGYWLHYASPLTFDHMHPLSPVYFSLFHHVCFGRPLPLLPRTSNSKAFTLTFSFSPDMTGPSHTTSLIHSIQKL